MRGGRGHGFESDIKFGNFTLNEKGTREFKDSLV